jgi:hypothetical protein
MMKTNNFRTTKGENHEQGSQIDQSLAEEQALAKGEAVAEEQALVHFGGCAYCPILGYIMVCFE